VPILYNERNDMVEFTLDKSRGYMYAIIPDHPCADKYGKVNEHHYVVYEETGRLLNEDEVVHHKDRDKANNKIDNLQVMTKSEHARLHMLEDRGGMIVTYTCELCGTNFEYRKSSPRKCCSVACSAMKKRKFEISKEELEKLVWEIPTTEIAKRYNVSDKAISKRCVSLGIVKPPRGYWSKPK